MAQPFYRYAGNQFSVFQNTCGGIRVKSVKTKNEVHNGRKAN
jgi:hypothetical protein